MAGGVIAEAARIRSALKRVRGSWKLRRAARWLSSYVVPTALILLYHRVVEAPSDTNQLAVTPRHFAEQLAVIRNHYRPVALGELVRAIETGRLRQRTVVVTLDDGYADNLHNARPLLERYEIPATVFVTSGLGPEREFWWDELDRLLLRPGRLPEMLRLNVAGQAYEWPLGEAAHYSEASFRRWSGWSLQRAPADDPGPRQRLYRALRRGLLPLAEGARRQALDQVAAWAGGAAGPPIHRRLSLDELVMLADCPLIEIGAHTVTHPLLPTLPAADQAEEVQASKARLEQIVGRPVTSFAYPYAVWAAATDAVVRTAGFSQACSALGVVRGSADRFQLLRFGVHDWDGETFAARLRRAFRA